MANFNYFYQQPFPGPSIYPTQIPTTSHYVEEAQLPPSQDFYLKVFNPTNKKEFKTVMLRNVIAEEINSPERLKDLVSEQCSVSKEMEVGYFKQSKKLWLSTRLDMNDMWELVRKGESVTLWCVESVKKSCKRGMLDSEVDEESSELAAKKPKKLSKMEERKAEAEKFEKFLTEKHGNVYTPFQIKLWAEMYVAKTHSSLEEPPQAAMFRRDNRHLKPHSDSSVMDGMFTVMNTLCQAITSKAEQPPAIMSPMKRAQLRSTYLKQLGELRELHENGVLHTEEYEEQRADIVDLMRKLNS